MISYFFNQAIYNPLYNGFVFLITIIPWADAGIVVVVFTVIVRLILFPLSKKSVETQIKMKQIEPELAEIKEKHKENKQEQAVQTMALYKKNNINPFSGFLLIFIQLPIIIALYYIFLKSGLPNIDIKLLYSFVHIPGPISMNFLGLLDISKKSIILAVLAGVTQFFQTRLSMPATTKRDDSKKPSFQDDLMRSMSLQMRYVMPIFMAFIAYSISGAVALYLVTSNTFTIGQELFVRRKKPTEVK